MTRHIDASSRITQSRITTKISPKTGKTRKRAKRPRQSLPGHLANLHLLLRSNSFSRWPLRLTFYAEDVHKAWQKISSQNIDKIRSGITVGIDDLPQDTSKTSKPTDPNVPPENVAIQLLDVGYGSLKPRLQKSQTKFSATARHTCAICDSPTPSSGATTLLCPNESCSSITHLTCLSKHFLSTSNAETLVPTSGTCPSCKSQHTWIDLVKELTLRMRGEKEIKALFKPKRMRKQAAATAAEESAGSSTDEDDEEDPLDMVLNEESKVIWHSLGESSSDEEPKTQMRKSSPNRKAKKRLKEPTTPHSEPIVKEIQESDWEGAELLT